MILLDVFDKIYETVKRIPRGKVATYGQIALLSGNPRWARVVGYALHQNKNPDTIPCYRVVRKDGSLAEGFAFGGEEVQRQMLMCDGIEFDENGRVIMAKYLWKISEE